MKPQRGGGGSGGGGPRHGAPDANPNWGSAQHFLGNKMTPRTDHIDANRDPETDTEVALRRTPEQGQDGRDS
jgi:hypothetical protein